MKIHQDKRRRPTEGAASVLLVVASLFLVTPLAATVPDHVELPEFVAASDHALIVRVEAVDMVNRRGFKVRSREAMTGPGKGRTIRLHLVVDEVLFSTAEEVPDGIVLPLESEFHYSLGQIQDAHADETQQFIVLLKGPDYRAPFFGYFSQPLQARDEILRLKDEPQAGAPEDTT